MLAAQNRPIVMAMGPEISIIERRVPQGGAAKMLSWMLVRRNGAFGVRRPHTIRTGIITSEKNKNARILDFLSFGLRKRKRKKISGI